MGCYVEFTSKEIKLRKDTPVEIIEFIDTLVNKNDCDIIPPTTHKFFTLERWDSLFYPHAFVDKKTYFKHENGYWILFIGCEINYGWEEIREFAKWITPYVSGHKPKEFIGLLKGEDRDDLENIYIDRVGDLINSKN
jgi:hypothetical protein